MYVDVDVDVDVVVLMSTDTRMLMCIWMLCCYVCVREY